MLFNSYIFILAFLPVTLIGYYTLNHFRLYRTAILWLCAASLFFYGYFNWLYLPIMLFSILFNFFLSRFIHPASWGKRLPGYGRKILFIFGVICNIGVLFYFKYFDFFVDNINAVFGTNFNLLHLLLPLGISFFTFQQVSYLADSVSGDGTNTYPFPVYALFVTFFPQLIAGPIVLHGEIVPQFLDKKKRKFNPDNFAKGLMAFSFGLAKKVLVADTFAAAVEAGFSQVDSLGTINAIVVMLSYTFQIYFDFSGYCDMATGIGKFFNIDIPMNFNSPYRALTITEFWDRWHMTLTRFFTRYVYIPLGGNRRGTVRTYVNVMIVFLISGLWHGANWTFLLWGALHGAASVVTRVFKKRISRWHPAFSWLCTFAFVNIAWVIFRAESISQGVLFLKQLGSLSFSPLLSGIQSAFVLPEFELLLKWLDAENCAYFLWFIFLCFALFACLRMKNANERLDRFKPAARSAVVPAILTVWSVLSLSGVSVFLYWNF